MIPIIDTELFEKELKEATKSGIPLGEAEKMLRKSFGISATGIPQIPVHSTSKNVSTGYSLSFISDRPFKDTVLEKWYSKSAVRFKIEPENVASNTVTWKAAIQSVSSITINRPVDSREEATIKKKLLDELYNHIYGDLRTEIRDIVGDLKSRGYHAIAEKLEKKFL